MKTKFHNNYRVNGGGLSSLAVLHADKAGNDRIFAYLVTLPDNSGIWALWTEQAVLIPHEPMVAITKKLKCLNKPPRKAPPEGYFRCLGCGVLVAIKQGVPYEEQCACPDHKCDGQLLCNEFSGWSKSC